MGRGTEAAIVLGLGICGLAVRTGMRFSQDVVPTTTDETQCALVTTDYLFLRRVPTTLENDPLTDDPFPTGSRIPYTGTMRMVTGQNVDVNRSDGNQWYSFRTLDGKDVYASSVYSYNSCSDRTTISGTR